MPRTVALIDFELRTALEERHGLPTDDLRYIFATEHVDALLAERNLVSRPSPARPA